MGISEAVNFRVFYVSQKKLQVYKSENFSEVKRIIDHN